MATVTKPPTDDARKGPTRFGSAKDAVSDKAGVIVSTAGDAVAKLPDFAITTRAAFEDANRRIQGGSDEMLTLGAAVSFGFAVGLLLGGANRILVVAAFLPVGTMGFALLDRSARARAGPPGGLHDSRRVNATHP